MKTITTFMGSMVLLVLFSLAIIGFALGFASDTNAAITIADDSDFASYKTASETSMDTYNEGASDTYKSLLKSTVEPGSNIFQSSAPFTITFANIFGTAKNIIDLPRKKIFGSDSEFNIFFNIFLAFIVFVLGLLAYKALKGNT